MLKNFFLSSLLFFGFTLPAFSLSPGLFPVNGDRSLVSSPYAYTNGFFTYNEYNKMLNWLPKLSKSCGVFFTMRNHVYSGENNPWHTLNSSQVYPSSFVIPPVPYTSSMGVAADPLLRQSMLSNPSGHHILFYDPSSKAWRVWFLHTPVAYDQTPQNLVDRPKVYDYNIFASTPLVAFQEAALRYTLSLPVRTSIPDNSSQTLIMKMSHPSQLLYLYSETLFFNGLNLNVNFRSSLTRPFTRTSGKVKITCPSAP